jgi:hypothetical protein
VVGRTTRGGIAGASVKTESLGGFPAFVDMLCQHVGDVIQATGERLLQRFAHLLVQATSFRAEQAFVGRLLNEDMSKGARTLVLVADADQLCALKVLEHTRPIHGG